jgi:type I restriction enzyme, S subunit
MVVRKGYKKTEYGMIPEEWDLFALKDISMYRRGSFPQPYGLKKWYDDVLGNPFIQVIDVTENMYLKPETKKRLSAEAEKMSVFAPNGSIIITLNGSVGRVALTTYDGFIDRTLLLFESFTIPIDKRYFMYAISAVFREEEKKAPGAILKTITKEHLSKFELPLPPLAEQKAIAEALSDADALIAALEGLIAKKRQIKQGTMQELLTGKRRLPGFSGKKAGHKQTEVGEIPEDWKIETLGQTTTLMTNGFVGSILQHYDESGNGVLYIQGYNVEENSFNLHGIKYVTEEFHHSHMKSCLCEGDLLTIQTGDVGLTTIVPDKLAGSNCHALIISRFNKKHYFPQYVAYYLNSKPGRARIRLIETGTTMKHLNVGDMLNFIVPLPPTLAEQEAIAIALKDMDTEIDALEIKLSKTRKIKQGMMQELLTGKIRLV